MGGTAGCVILSALWLCSNVRILAYFRPRIPLTLSPRLLLVYVHNVAGAARRKNHRGRQPTSVEHSESQKTKKVQMLTRVDPLSASYILVVFHIIIYYLFQILLFCAC